MNEMSAVVALVSVAVTEVGLSGADGGFGVVIVFDGSEAAESPIAFLAATVNVYSVPSDNPVIAIVPLPACEMLPVRLPGEDVAIYLVIVSPPLDVGAMNETFAVVELVNVAVTLGGASGTLGVVIAADESDAIEFPTAFSAATVNVYEMPGDKPVKAIVPLPD